MALIRTCLRMTAKPGGRDELVDAFLDAGVLDRSAKQDGFLGAELVKCDEDHDSVLVLALWTGREAYGGWLESPVRDEISAALEPLIASERVEICEQVVSRGPDSL
jgi:heme-degrading monooxygenase HmoA